MELSCFEFANNRLWGECPIFLAKVKKYWNARGKVKVIASGKRGDGGKTGKNRKCTDLRFTDILPSDGDRNQGDFGNRDVGNGRNMHVFARCA